MALRGKGGRYVTKGQAAIDFGGALGREQKFVNKMKAKGWSASESRRVHRANNLKSIRKKQGRA